MGSNHSTSTQCLACFVLVITTNDKSLRDFVPFIRRQRKGNIEDFKFGGTQGTKRHKHETPSSDKENEVQGEFDYGRYPYRHAFSADNAFLSVRARQEERAAARRRRRDRFKMQQYIDDMEDEFAERDRDEMFRFLAYGAQTLRPAYMHYR